MNIKTKDLKNLIGKLMWLSIVLSDTVYTVNPKQLAALFNLINSLDTYEGDVDTITIEMSSVFEGELWIERSSPLKEYAPIHIENSGRIVCSHFVNEENY